MNKKLNKHRIMILGIVLCSIILFIPLFKNPYYIKDDTVFHITNINTIAKLIENNFWDGLSAKILPLIANNFGYGTRLFYPPLAHTLSAYITYFLSFFNIDLLTSVKITQYLIFMLSGIMMYFCFYRFEKNKILSFIASLIYMTSAYHINDIYVRDAQAESLLFLFMPLIVTGIKELFEGNKKLFYPLFIIGYTGGILSHFTLMLYFTLFLGICFIVYHKQVLEKKFIIPFFKATILVILLTLFFLEPLVEHKIFGNYLVYKQGVMTEGVQYKALWGYEYFIKTGRIPRCFSIVTIVLLIYLLVHKRKSLKETKYKFLLLFGGISFYLSTVYFPWFAMPYSFQIIQFAWRLAAMVILIVSFLVPLALKECHSKKVYFIVISGLIISGLYFINISTTDEMNIENIDYLSAMGNQMEYLPVNTSEKIYYLYSRSEDVLIKSGNGTVVTLENDVPYLCFTVDSKEEVTVEMPRIFYFGYVLKDDNGKTYSVYENDNGFVSSKLSSGTYTLDFEGSTAYKVSKFVSLFTFLGIILYIIKKII